MSKLNRKPKVMYSTSEDDDDDDDDFLSTHNESPDVSSENSYSSFDNIVKSKNKNRVISSDESDDSDNESGIRNSTNATSDVDGQNSASQNGTNGFGEILADESIALDSASTSTQNSGAEESIIVPDTDDEEEEKLFQEIHFSPKSRRSITGRRSIAPGRLSLAPKDNNILETSDEDDDDDDDFFKLSKSKAADNAIELSTSRVDSFGLPKPNAESSGIDAAKQSLIASSIDSNTILDDESRMSGNDIQTISSTDESENGNTRSSIIESATDDNDDDDVSFVCETSTPGPSKKLVQPTTRKYMKRFVSQEFYAQKKKELNQAKDDLKATIELHNELQIKLPDNGAKLMESVKTLKSKVQILEKELTELKVEEENLNEVQAQIGAADDWRAGLNQIQPKFTGKIGLNTHNTQKALTINRLEKLHKAMQLCPGDHELAETPPNLKVSLMPHQLHAIKWMRWREKQKPKGGLLADDMGLGKTLTVIGLVLDAIYGTDDDDDKENDDSDSNDDFDDDDDDDVDRIHKNKSKKNGGTLVVCPASLVNQWNHEIQTRVKRNKLNILMHHGNNRKGNVNVICKHDIVLTTYGVLSSEHKSNGPLFRIHWDRIVLDEAHMVRNHTTAMSKAACELRANIRWGLTGTPIQNKSMDVYSMLKYLKVSPFNDLQTFLKFSDPRSAGGMNRLHNILKPLLLRRTKAELQIRGELSALPEKIINIEQIDLSSDESTVYTHVLTYSQGVFMKYVAQHQAQKSGFMQDGPYVLPDEIRNRLKNIKSSIFNADVQTATILVLMLRLRQICDHPGLIKSMLNDNDDLGEEEIEENNGVDLNMMKALVGLDLNGKESDAVENADDAVKLHNILSVNNPVYDLMNPSSKCKRVTEMVVRLLKETEDKMIIVSQWTSVLNIVGNHLRSKGIEFVELTGKTPIKLRNDIVVSFNKPHTPERIMLLSLVAGGVGLNLTGANHLFLMDPHWNPQLESQAFDRVYRVGQTKNVQIYKLLCNNTIEKVIQDIQNKKLELSTNILTGSKMNSGTKLSFQDMCALFEMGGA